MKALKMYNETRGLVNKAVMRQKGIDSELL
jgi:hypothetical protein